MALKADLEKVIKLWKLSRIRLTGQQLWAAGYRPGQAVPEAPAVGSGFDASDRIARLMPIGSGATDFEA